MTYDIARSNSKVDYAYNCFYNVKQLTVLLAEVEMDIDFSGSAIRKIIESLRLNDEGKSRCSSL